MRVPLTVRATPAFAFQAWLTPPPLGRSTAVRDLERVAGMSRVFYGGRPGFETGEGPLVIAMHGWGGRPAQLAPVAKRLAADGFHVVVPTLPGHAGGERTDIEEVVRALVSVIDDVGEPDAIVAHSFAAMALRLAFPESAPERVALVAPALDARDAVDVFGDRLGLLPWARRGLLRRLESWDPSVWPILSDVHPGQLPGADILILHDPDDTDTPFVRSAELAAIRPNTSIVAVGSAGHSGILSDDRTLDILSGFVSSTPISSHSAA